MRTLANRLEALELRAMPPCHCVALEFCAKDGTPERPTPPLCPHGRPWRLTRQYIGVRGDAV